MKKTLLFLFCFIGVAVSAGAQEKTSWLGGIIDWIGRPNPKLDSLAVYQPAPRWNVTLTGTGRQIGAMQKSSFSTMSVKEENGTFIEFTYPGSVKLDLQEKMYRGVGAYVGYGKLSLGMSTEIGRKSAQKNRSFSFDIVSSGYGLQFSYYDIWQPMEYDLLLGNDETDPVYAHRQGTSYEPGNLKMFIADAFYAVNQHSFAYSAVYKGSKIQRRSAGSILLYSKYLRGKISTDPMDVISSWTDHLIHYTTSQLSVGAGYSYNLVAFHRQPVDRQTNRGLRNLTFNVTAIPLLTAYGHLSSSRAIFNEEGVVVDEERSSTTNSSAWLNFEARAGMCYSWNQFFVGLTVDYDSFSFQGKTESSREELDFEDIKTNGRFHKWMAVLRVNMAF